MIKKVCNLCGVAIEGECRHMSIDFHDTLCPCIFDGDVCDECFEKRFGGIWWHKREGVFTQEYIELVEK